MKHYYTQNRPYAQFRYGGAVYSYSKQAFERYADDGDRCGCDKCLKCRAAEYRRETSDK